MHELLLLQLKKVLNLSSVQLREIRENPHCLNSLLQNTDPNALRQVFREISSSYDEQEQQNQRLNRALRLSARESDELAQELHRQEERKYHFLFEHMTSGFVLFEALYDSTGNLHDARFAEVNPAFLRLIEQKWEDLAGRTLRQLRPTIDADLVQKAGQVIETGLPHFFEYFEADGRKYIEVCLYRPAEKHLAVMLSDITQRRLAELQLQESEERYRSLIENIGMSITLIDRNFRIITTNSATGNLFHKPSCEFVNRYCFQEFEKAPTPCDGCPGRISMDLNRPFEVEREGVRDDGTRFVVRIRTFPTHNTHGQCTGFIEVVQDISDQRRAAEERQKIESQMQQAQKLESLGLMAGGIAHDFNNLLTVIMGNIDVCKHCATLPREVNENLQDAWAATRRASDLCRQLLAYSGKAPLQLTVFNINDLIREHVHLFEVSISKKIQIEYSLSSQLPAIEGDATQIEQIVMNLIINSAEAIGTNPGHIKIITSSRHCDHFLLSGTWLQQDLPEGPYVCIEVQDTGCGMDTITLSRIFDPFFSTKFPGRGLGLAALLGIVRRHRGTLKVTSAQGKGTTFQIYFPVSPRDLISPATPGVSPSTPQPLLSGTVLLADDESSIRDISAQLLELLGLQVMTAADGEEALHLFRTCRQMISTPKSRIKCVILDLTMPRLDGIEALIELRRIDPDIPVLLASGYAEADISERLKDVRPSGFIQKPYALETLKNMLAPFMTPD